MRETIPAMFLHFLRDAIMVAQAGEFVKIFLLHPQKAVKQRFKIFSPWDPGTAY